MCADMQADQFTDCSNELKQQQTVGYCGELQQKAYKFVEDRKQRAYKTVEFQTAYKNVGSGVNKKRIKMQPHASEYKTPDYKTDIAVKIVA